MKSAAVVVLGEEGGMNVVFRMTELFGKDSFFFEDFKGERSMKMICRVWEEWMQRRT